MIQNLIDKKIKKNIMLDYPQIKKINKINILNKKGNSETYLLNTENKKFVLKYFLDNSKPEKIEKICKILDYCSNFSKVEKPIKNKKKFYVNSIDNYYLTEFYPGSISNGGLKEMKDLTLQLSQFHKSIKNVNVIFNYKTNLKLSSILKKSEIQKLYSNIIKKNNQTKFDKFFIKHFSFLNSAIDFDFNISKNSNLIKYPKQLIHDDLHERNLLFKNSKLTSIIDFSTLKKGNIIDDVSFCSLRFALIENKKIDDINTSIKLFFKYYLNHNLIPSKHLENLSFFQSHKILHGISFLIRNHYFNNQILWDNDFLKYIHLLKIVKNKKLIIDF